MCPPVMETGRSENRAVQEKVKKQVQVCTHTKTQAHTRTQLIEGDSHFSRGELHAELHLL